MRKKTGRCRVNGCSFPPYLGGLCRDHHESDAVRSRLRNAAVSALHGEAVSGGLPEEPELRAEFLKLRERWFRVCDVVRSQRGTTKVPLDEADAVTEWCITLAAALLEAEQAFRDGKPLPAKSEHTRR